MYEFSGHNVAVGLKFSLTTCDPPDVSMSHWCGSPHFEKSCLMVMLLCCGKSQISD